MLNTFLNRLPTDRIILKLLSLLPSGTKEHQRFYRQLYQHSLTGMNYGNGGNFEQSGELYALQFIKGQARAKPLTIFDVGANVGNYAKALTAQFPSATIHSFEPSAQTFKTFLQTTTGIKNLIPNNFGLSDTETSLTLYSNPDIHVLSSVYNRQLDHFGLSLSETEEIRLTTVDDYCQKFGIDRIHFLKLDIEGHELSALKGAARMLDKIDFIQFEFGGSNIDSRTYFQDFWYFLKDRFRIYRIVKDGLAEITSYSESNEIFITINYLAVAR